MLNVMSRLGMAALLGGLLIANFGLAEAIASGGTCTGSYTIYDTNNNRWGVQCQGACPQPQKCDEFGIGSMPVTYVCGCDGVLVDTMVVDCRPVAYDDGGTGGHFCAKLLCAAPECDEEYDEYFDIYECVCP